MIHIEYVLPDQELFDCSENGSSVEAEMNEEEEMKSAEENTAPEIDDDADFEFIDISEDEEQTSKEDDDFDQIEVDTEELGEEELFAALDQSLMQQVQEEMDAEEQETEESTQPETTEEEMVPEKKKGKKILRILLGVFLVIVLLIVFFVATKPGRKAVYWMIGKYVEFRTGTEKPDEEGTLTPLPNITTTPPENLTGAPTPTPFEGEEDENTPVQIPVTYSLRQEDYCKNFLIFGLEQINGASNTDTMMIATINTKTKTVKLTSILRDMYVELEDGKGRKLNSVYARGRKSGQGPELLMATLEKYYKIDLEGYAYVNFSSFEKIVDMLGGVKIELGKTEAKYLNETNYISDPANRNVKPGLQRLNGNQVVGYCRIRKVVTLGGATSDYGRTVRQRRVLQAIFEEYKSKNVFELLSITDKCLSYVTTDLSAEQIAELLEMLVENGITTMETSRIPLDKSYYDSGLEGYNGITYGLVVNDLETNIKYLFEYLYGDTPEEAEEHYKQLEK